MRVYVPTISPEVKAVYAFHDGQQVPEGEEEEEEDMEHNVKLQHMGLFGSFGFYHRQESMFMPSLLKAYEWTRSQWAHARARHILREDSVGIAISVAGVRVRPTPSHRGGRERERRRGEGREQDEGDSESECERTNSQVRIRERERERGVKRELKVECGESDRREREKRGTKLGKRNRFVPT